MTQSRRSSRCSPPLRARAGSARDGEAGLTLVEVLVALALFSLIGVAGFAVLDGVLRTQSGTDQRLERLADIQRAMHVVTLDLEQLAAPPLVHNGTAITFERVDARAETGRLSVGYTLADQALIRSLRTPLGQVVSDQRVLDGVTSLRWRFFDDGTWRPVWPADRPHAPEGVEMTIRLDDALPGLSGEMRRVVVIPTGGP